MSAPAAGGVSSISAVSCARGRLDIFTVGQDGNIYWAFRGGIPRGSAAGLMFKGLVGQPTVMASAVVGPNALLEQPNLPSGNLPSEGSAQGGLSGGPAGGTKPPLGMLGGPVVGAFHGESASVPVPDWSPWAVIPGLNVCPLAPVCAVSRGFGLIDVFVVGFDGLVHQSSWSGLGTGGWSGWAVVGGDPLKLVTVLHAPITGVVRAGGRLDLFGTDIDGTILWARRDPQTGAWDGWRPVSPISAPLVPPGAPVGAASAAPYLMAVFVAANDGQIYFTERDTTIGEHYWASWWPIGADEVQARSPIVAVSRSSWQLDLFYVGKDNHVRNAWRTGPNPWNAFVMEGLVAGSTRAVAAISRGYDLLDVLVVADTGSVLHAAWSEKGGWKGWNVVGLIEVIPRATIGLGSPAADDLHIFVVGLNGHSLTTSRELDSVVTPVKWQWHGWRNIPWVSCNLADPKIDQWYDVGVALDINYDKSVWGNQGATNDGVFWYVVANSDDSRRLTKFGTQPGTDMLDDGTAVDIGVANHIGPPFLFVHPKTHEASILIATQGPYGVFRISTALGDANWMAPETVEGHPDPNHFAWCSVNPLNGRLYTAPFEADTLRICWAFDVVSLKRCPEDDIVLGPSTLNLSDAGDRGVQAAVFTSRGHLVLVRNNPNVIFCFSSITGHCFGNKDLGNWGHGPSEPENVFVRSLELDSEFPSQVHVSENFHSILKDLQFLQVHSLRTPEPWLL